jgi:hypothetical protein
VSVWLDKYDKWAPKSRVIPADLYGRFHSMWLLFLQIFTTSWEKNGTTKGTKGFCMGPSRHIIRGKKLKLPYLDIHFQQVAALWGESRVFVTPSWTSCQVGAKSTCAWRCHIYTLSSNKWPLYEGNLMFLYIARSLTSCQVGAKSSCAWSPIHLLHKFEKKILVPMSRQD